ncbi:MAG: TlpA disulfide reductase family protein [Candidatus Methylomirabilaceae bacterium]
MTIQTRYLLATLGLVAAAGVVVYLAATPAAPPSAEVPPLSAAPQFQPIPTPPGQIITRGLREGARAPDFSARRFGGGILGLADLRGKGVVMNFFASWCAPCRAEARDLDGAFQKYRNQGIVFLGVNVEQDTWDDAREFLDEFKISYPAVRDESSDIARKYQLLGLPTSYFIDKAGLIRAKFVGPFLGPEGLKALEERIKMILP